MINSKHRSVQPGSSQRALIDVVHAVLAAQFAPTCYILSWNAAPYNLPGFRLTTRRDGRVIVRHVLTDMRTHASRRNSVVAMLERYQRALVARGIHTQLIDQRGKAPQIVCHISKT